MTPVVVAGGGTGGHLYPGLAVAAALSARGCAVTFVGTAGGIEARVVPGAGYPLRLLPGSQLRGGGVARAAAGSLALASGTFRGLGLLRALKPALAIGVGGYASVAVVLAARLRRVPVVLLEQNVIPGAANRVLARLAARVCAGFEESTALFPPGRALFTGNPVRTEILRAAVAAGPRARPGVLVFGGSAGARHLNEATVDAIRHLAPEPGTLDLLHQTGAADVEAVRAAYAVLGFPARVVPFIDDMGAAYAAADVVVARAGATTCAELTALGLPGILVPYPHAADDHQRHNAQVLVRAGAAEMILDPDLDGARLAATLERLLKDPTRRAAMSTRSRALGRPDAAERVADECLRLVRR